MCGTVITFFSILHGRPASLTPRDSADAAQLPLVPSLEKNEVVPEEPEAGACF